MGESGGSSSGLAGGGHESAASCRRVRIGEGTFFELSLTELVAIAQETTAGGEGISMPELSVVVSTDLAVSVAGVELDGTSGVEQESTSIA